MRRRRRLVIPWGFSRTPLFILGPFGGLFPRVGPGFPAFRRPTRSHVGGEPFFYFPYEQRSGWMGTDPRSRA